MLLTISSNLSDFCKSIRYDLGGSKQDMEGKVKKLMGASAILMLLTAMPAAQSLELIIGEEKVSPGIVLVFEGAIKDTVFPEEQNLAVGQTDVHIEARVNWSEDGPLPPGAPAGGFIPYLEINAVVTSQTNGESVHATLLPHINAIDNFHYARNIALPSAISDRYEVVFYISPPGEFELAFHKDWKDAYGTPLIKPVTFSYKNTDFEKIAKAKRN